MTAIVQETVLPANPRSRLAVAIWSSLQFAGSFTDLLIHEGEPIRVKSARGLIALEALGVPGGDIRPSLQDIQQFFASYVSEAGVRESATEYWAEFIAPAFKEQRPVNRSLRTPNNEMLRFSILQHGGGRVGMMVRVTTPPPPLDQIGLTQVIMQRLRDNPKGLLIITGPTASGKTATALSILDYMNLHASGHIVTIEDPVEYPMTSRGCLFTQRSVGVDVATFGSGLWDAMRMSPDAILAGEVRDKDTADAAILGGESGALMIVTTHGRSIPGTLRKILMLTGDATAQAMRSVLAGSLIGVIRQELVPFANGQGYSMVHDTLHGSETVSKLIDRGDWTALDELCTRDDGANFVSMYPALNELARTRKIDPLLASSMFSHRRTGPY